MKDPVVGPNSRFNFFIHPYAFRWAFAFLVVVGRLMEHAVLSEMSVTRDAGLVVILGLGILWGSGNVMSFVD